MINDQKYVSVPGLPCFEVRITEKVDVLTKGFLYKLSNNSSFKKL